MPPALRASVEIDARVLTGFDSVIDVRSASEFADDHLPGAVNCPVLDDAQRAEVGTRYRQDSPFAARRLGAAYVARNIAAHLETTFADRPRDWRPLVYCWRGGKRSGAMAHVLHEVGWAARTLAGGYKAYRRFVLERLAARPAELAFCVVHGATGSGKSRLLQALHARGAQVLDLEALAEHRGSVLGGLPGRPQPSQRLFESRLRQALDAFDPALEVFVEGESRRIGRLRVPDALLEAMRASRCLRIDAPTATRVALLLEEYRHYLDDPAPLAAQLECLAPLHGVARVGEWTQLAAQGAWPSLVARLLAEHYDPAYRRSSGQNFPRLGDAQVLSLETASDAAFDRLARAAMAPAEPPRGAVAGGAA